MTDFTVFMLWLLACASWYRWTVRRPKELGRVRVAGSWWQRAAREQSYRQGEHHYGR